MIRSVSRDLFWLGLLVILFWPPVVIAQQQADSCSTCHLAIGVDRLTKPVQQFKDDIHAAKGFGCVSCHGGDATSPGMEAMDRAKDISASPHQLK